MNKALLLEKIITVLEITYQNAVEAAMRAYNTATNDENVAENKYDTLALEASYLAHGQALRVAECEADIAATYPPGPPPIIARSQLFCICSVVIVLFISTPPDYYIVLQLYQVKITSTHPSICNYSTSISQ